MRDVLITGASSGFGKWIAETFTRAGDRVIGTSRSSRTPEAISSTGLTMVPLDVRVDESVSELRQLLLISDFVPDILILNAGYGISGAIEETPVEEADNQFQTNFFGVHRVVRAWLPHMRGRGSGRIIIIGSLAARLSVPFQAFYSASKAAVASYAEALRMEVKAYGISVSVVEPGDHKTEFARTSVEVRSDSPYEPQASRAVNIMERSEAKGASSESLAELILRVAQESKPRFRYTKGSLLEKSVVGVCNIMPASFREWLVMSNYRLPSK